MKLGSFVVQFIMFKLLAVFVLLVAVSATPSVRHRFEQNALRINAQKTLRGGRIVGGVDSRIEDFPYQVAMFFNQRFTCGGAVLNQNTILSAAHCTNGRNQNNFQILAGQTDNTQGSLNTVIELIEHPEYDDWTLLNDVVLMKLANILIFSDQIRPVVLPTPNFQVQPQRPADLAGWGTMEWGTSQFPAILQSVVVPTMTNAQCQVIYDEEEIIDQHLCAGEVGRDACQGDSGGPLIYNGVQVGIVSWGYGCAFEWPTVYARVSEFLGFILQNA